MFQPMYQKQPRLNLSCWTPLLMLLLSMFLLTGCAGRIAEHTTIETRALPKTLLTDCKPNEPPTTEAILNSRTTFPKAKSHWEAIALLFEDHWEKQTLQVGLCNDQLQAIKEWYEKQSTLEKNHDVAGGTYFTW